MKEYTEGEALSKAAAYCSAAERCESEVLSKLSQWGMDSQQSAAIMSRLISERFVDEFRYCRSFVRDKFLYNKWGRVKIVQALRLKKVSDKAASEALDEIDEQEYMSVLRELLAAKSRTVRSSSEYDKKAKLMRFALSRGFEMDVIRRCINIDTDDTY